MLFHLPMSAQAQNIVAVVVQEPENADEVVATFELLVEQYGQTVGDGFLLWLDDLAREKGLVDANGRRTRKSRQLAQS